MAKQPTQLSGCSLSLVVYGGGHISWGDEEEEPGLL